MDKYKEYIKKEQKELNNKKSDILNDIHIVEMNIESYEQTIIKLKAEKNETASFFKAINDNDVSNNKEIEALELEKENVIKKQENLKLELDKVENKLLEIQEVLKEDSQAENEILKSLKIFDKFIEKNLWNLDEAVLQKMTVINAKAEFIKKIIDSDTRRSKIEIDNIEKISSECLFELRKMIYYLYPVMMEETTLKAIFEQYYSEKLYDLDLNVDISIDENITRKNVGKYIITNTFFIIDELITNTIKHANAKNIMIDVDLEGNILKILYEDDGRGFTKEKENFGYGIAGINERVKMFYGNMNCSHDVGKGTMYSISFLCEVGKTM